MPHRSVPSRQTSITTFNTRHRPIGSATCYTSNTGQRVLGQSAAENAAALLFSSNLQESGQHTRGEYLCHRRQRSPTNSVHAQHSKLPTAKLAFIISVPSQVRTSHPSRNYPLLCASCWRTRCATVTWSLD